MDQLPINAEIINKSLDIIDSSTEGTRKELDTINAKGINKLAQLFWASPLGIKTDVYIKERPYKLEMALEEMRKKYEKTIPVECQVEPSSYIALKGAIELNYSLDEEHLKNLFQNLLLSDMDNRKKNRVKPVYIEIIKQLSKEDAETLKLIHDYILSSTHIIRVKYDLMGGGFGDFDRSIFMIVDTSTRYRLKPIIVDNLTHLNLIEIDFTQYFSDSGTYEKTFEEIKSNYNPKNFPGNVSKLNFDKGILKITDFGRDFMNICLS